LSRARRVSDPVSVTSFDWQRAAEAPVQPAHAVSSSPDTSTVEASAQHLAAIARDAFATGFAQGERAGGEAAAKRGEAMLRRLTQTLEELTDLRAQMIRETEQQMVRLALAIARRVLHREVSLDQDLLIAMARVALDRLGENAQVTVRLHPEDYEATASARASAWTGAQVKVAPDTRVPRGGCRIESDFGALDAGVDAQLQEIAHALLGEAVHVPHASRR
jgi:flagellar assembly protein FliH